MPCAPLQVWVAGPLKLCFPSVQEDWGWEWTRLGLSDDGHIMDTLVINYRLDTTLFYFLSKNSSYKWLMFVTAVCHRTPRLN